MKAFILLAALFTQMACADTYSHKLFYDEDKTDELDIKVDVVLTGKFNKSSKVTAIRIWGIRKNKNVLLFNISGKDITARWTGHDVLDINTSIVNSLVKEQYYPVHSDTQIDPESDYSITDMKINEAGTIEGNYEEFYMGNDSYEEMALAGFLKKI